MIFGSTTLARGRRVALGRERHLFGESLAKREKDVVVFVLLLRAQINAICIIIWPRFLIQFPPAGRSNGDATRESAERREPPGEPVEM